MKEFLEDIGKIAKISPYGSHEDARLRTALEYDVMSEFIREIVKTGGTYALKAKLIVELIDE